MKKVFLICISALLITGLMLSAEGCQSQTKASSSQEVATAYLQAVLDNDTKTRDQLSPYFIRIPSDILIGTIFRVGDIGKAKILQSHILTAEECRATIIKIQSPDTPDQSALDMSVVRANLEKLYSVGNNSVSNIIFYKFDVQETSGKKRDLSAYVMTMKSKGGWVAAPGIEEGFASYPDN